MDRDLEILAVASVGALAKGHAKRAAKLGTPCANCGAILSGPYCHDCGQLAEDFERSIGSLLVEVFENLFHADGRLFHTLPRLAFKPATLTRDYLAGRRAAQMPPLRLFLVVILVFFFAGGVRNALHPSHANLYRPTPHEFNPFGLSDHDYGDKSIKAWLKPRLTYTMTHQREFAMALEGWLHRIAIIFLPVSTILLSILFVFQRRFFIFDHAIFSMHSLAFMGLLFTIITLVRLIPYTGVVDLLVFAAPTHLFVHMRGVYRTSWFGTLLRMLLLFILSLVCFAVLMAGVVVLEFNGMGS